jgi:hypothetical protein
MDFGELIKGVGTVKTPGTPIFNLIQPKNDDDKISEEDQKIYRTGVGSLHYLVKHSRPNISSAVR